MSLFDSPLVLQVDDALRDELRLNNPAGSLFEIKPYKESDRAMQDNIEMYRALHDVDEWNGFNTSPTNSFELWFDGENLRVMMYVDDDDHVRRAIRHVTSNFPSAHIVTPDEATNPVMLPNIENGKYVAGARFHLTMHFYAPIRNPNGVEQFHAPYRNIAAEMVNNDDVTEIIQVLFKPAGTDWTSSKFTDAAAFAEGLTADINVDTLDADPDETAKAPSEMVSAANNIKSQIGQPGFYVSLRVLCIADEKDKALQQMDDISAAFHNYYREHTGQTFAPAPQQGYGLQRLLNETVARNGRRMDWPKGLRHRRRMRNGDPCDTIIMTIPELAGLAHIPNDDHLETSAVDWVVLDSSHRLPAQAPKYEDNKGEPDDHDAIPWRMDDDTNETATETAHPALDDDAHDAPELPDDAEDDTPPTPPLPANSSDDASEREDTTANDEPEPDQEDYRWPVKPDDTRTDGG